jgi:hypothetical protein
LSRIVTVLLLILHQRSFLLLLLRRLASMRDGMQVNSMIKGANV